MWSSSSPFELRVSSPSPALIPPMNRLPTSPTDIRLWLDRRDGEVMQMCGGGGIAGRWLLLSLDEPAGCKCRWLELRPEQRHFNKLVVIATYDLATHCLVYTAKYFDLS